MGFAIGFGSIEVERERAEREAIEEYIKQACAERGEHYVSHELAENVSQWLSVRAKASRMESDSYKDAESFPDRYSSFYSDTAHNASRIFVRISWSHINRRHGLSPDGWAMLQNEQVFCVAPGI